MNISKIFNVLTQFAIPILTIGTQIAIAMKYPQWGLVINLLAQPFWLYTAWKSWKEAGQIGLFVTSIIVSVIIAFGVINYWLL